MFHLIEQKIYIDYYTDWILYCYTVKNWYLDVEGILMGLLGVTISASYCMRVGENMWFRALQ